MMMLGLASVGVFPAFLFHSSALARSSERMELRNAERLRVYLEALVLYAHSIHAAIRK